MQSSSFDSTCIKGRLSFAAAIVAALGIAVCLLAGTPAVGTAYADDTALSVQGETAGHLVYSTTVNQGVEAIQITDYTGTDTTVVVPNKIEGKDVVYVKLDNQGLTKLDVSACTALYYLECSSNKLTALDVSNNTALESLVCPNNALTSLDVSKCTKLSSLSCFNNQLYALNVDGNTALTKLWCFNNSIIDATALTKRFGTDANVVMPQNDARYLSFPDVKAAVAANGLSDYTWYVRDGWLDYVAVNGLMSGYKSNGNFGPFDDITRGQVAAILYRYACGLDTTLETTYGSTLNSSTYGSTSTFDDEEVSVYYTAAINWAKDAGIMTGDGSTSYTTVRPDDAITREELCTMMARFAQKIGHASASEGTVDYSAVQGMDAVSDWAADSVNWCASYGIIGGVNKNGSYYMNPQDNTWRSSMAKMITVTVRDVL